MSVGASEDVRKRVTTTDRNHRRHKSDQPTIYIDSDAALQQYPDSTVDSKRSHHKHKPRRDRDDKKVHGHMIADEVNEEFVPHKHKHSRSLDETRHQRKHKQVTKDLGNEVGDIKKSRRHRVPYDIHDERRPREHDKPHKHHQEEIKSHKSHKHRRDTNGPKNEPKKKITLSERFSDPCDEFTFDENISIGIHRAISSRAGKPPAKVTHEIDLDMFMLSRRRDEGRKPMFMREEILKFHYDDRLEEQLEAEEKRVIKVDKQEKKSTAYNTTHITRTVPGGDSRDHGGNDRNSFRRRSWNGPGNNKGMTRDNRPDDNESKLPDFSKRPDRYRYDERFQNPESIPRGQGYFDHDNRDDFPSGRFANYPRGRGGNRGFGRGSSYMRQSSNSDGKWQHDMFDQLNQE